MDPRIPELRTAPRDERDLMIAANSGWCLGFDNLSRLAVWFSDGLCRLSTGGGFSTRKLYTNGEEYVIDVKRPSVLNGIEDVVIRGDLLDRTISLHLPPISPNKRRSEDEFWREFNEAAPRIFGAILDGISRGLRDYASVALRNPPRLADQARWISAAERAFGWRPGRFLRAFQANQREGHRRVVDGNTVATLVAELAGGSTWEGTASDLLCALRALNEIAGGANGLPSDPGRLGTILRRLIPNLGAVGVDVGFSRKGRDGIRTIHIQKLRSRRQHRQRQRQKRHKVSRGGDGPRRCLTPATPQRNRRCSND